MGFKYISVACYKNIAVILLNRPQFLNALNKEMVKELGQAFAELAQNDEIRAVIISGEKHFAAGADIADMVNFTPEQAKQFSFSSIFSQIEEFPKPVIAAISGFALGGGLELALCCDFRIASPASKLGLPEINLGIFPGAGGTQRLPLLVGVSRAKMLIYSGDIIDAQTALDYGLVDRLAENPLEEARQLALKFSQKAPVALMLAKKCINNINRLDSVSGMETEALAWASCFSTHDQKEGMQAFLAKRKPRFVGQ